MSNIVEERIRYLADLADAATERFDFVLLPHQIPPADLDWFFWLLEAGRGAGKTAAAAHYVKDHLNGPRCFPPVPGERDLPHRVSLIAPTLGDGIESANLNDQALTRIEPGAKLTTSGGGSRVDWPNGSQVRIFGAHTREDVNRLRAGGNRCLVWAEEIAAWRYLAEAWEDMMFGLRIGEKVRIVGSTTPRARPEYLEVRKQADIIAHATTLDNPSLNEEQKERLVEIYGDTSVGRQEIYGELLDEAEGALWSYALIEENRIETPNSVGRIVLGLDPPGGVTEAGIVVAGELPNCDCGGARLPHYAVLEDASGTYSPEVWASVSVSTLEAWGGDRIVAEKNFGGDMVEATIRNVSADVPVKNVTASRGKRLRAEPIKALYEQARVHHVGVLGPLETEMVQWIPDESPWSPNRLDALVWALTELSTGKKRPSLAGWTVDGDLRKSRGI